MKQPAPHRHEQQRVRTVRDLDLVRGDMDAAADTLVGDLTRRTGIPTCLFSVVDADHQYFRAREGLEVSALPRASSFCGHAINSDQLIFVVEDASQDPAFADNPLVTGPPRIRFYAGAQIFAPNGLPVGALCLIDNKSNTLTEDARDALLEGKQLLEEWLRRREKEAQ